MIKQISSWQGRVCINGAEYQSVSDIPATLRLTAGTVITLLPKQLAVQSKQSVDESNDVRTLAITVKEYMTKRATPEFDFMAKWNNNIPMPMRTMVGTKVKETKGMVYMQLHGDLIAEKTCNCMYCGRPLTNPVSQFFGCGPECGGHNYTHPFDTDEELRAAVASYREQLREVTWEGWVIKSAILDIQEV